MLSVNARKSFVFYFGFCLLYLLTQLAVNSTVSFFHFLLEHDMATIDGLISKNNWELIVLSKVITFFVCLKFVSLNYADKYQLTTELKKRISYPTQTGILFSLFLVGVITVVSEYFYVPAKINLDTEGEFLSSYLGVIAFMLTDLVFLFFVSLVYPTEKKDRSFFFILHLILFGLSTYLSIPYLGIYLILALLHFITLYYFTRMGRFSDAVLYCFVTVAPMNSILGLNLFSGWEESRSFELQFFIVAIIIWSIAFIYDRFSRLN